MRKRTITDHQLNSGDSMKPRNRLAKSLSLKALKVRVIKRHEREQPKSPAPAATDGLDLERKCETVVSTWVRDHWLRAQEMQQNLSGRLKEVGFFRHPLTIPHKAGFQR
jgi:hypothetical protein